MIKIDKNIFLIVVFIVSAVLLCDVRLFGIELYTIFLLFCCFFLLLKHVVNGGIIDTLSSIKIGKSITKMVLLFFVWEICRLFFSLFRFLSNSELSFESTIVLLFVAILLIIYRKSKGIDICKFEFLPIYCFLIFMIEGFFIGTNSEFISKTFSIVLYDNKMATYIVFFEILLGMSLEKSRYKMRKYIYVLLIGVGYVELALTADWLCICVLILYYLVIPIFRLPTKYLISFYMKQLFALLFMISNMSLIIGYTDFFARKEYLPLEASIYIDVILAVCGVIFFNYWEKMPENVDPNRLILKKMRKGFKIAAFTFSCILLAIIIGADRLIVPADSDVGGFRLALSIVASDVRNRGNIMTSMIADGDAIGLILIILIISMMIYKSAKNISFFKPRLSSLALISCVFVILLLTTEVNANVAVIGVLILISAAYGEEPRQTYTIRKFNYDTDIENDNRGLEEQDELSIEQN